MWTVFITPFPFVRFLKNLLPDGYLNLVCPYFPSFLRSIFELLAVDSTLGEASREDLSIWSSLFQKQNLFFWEEIGSYLFYSLFFIQIKPFSHGSGLEVGTKASFFSEWHPILGVECPVGWGGLGRWGFLQKRHQRAPCPFCHVRTQGIGHLTCRRGPAQSCLCWSCDLDQTSSSQNCEECVSVVCKLPGLCCFSS